MMTPSTNRRMDALARGTTTSGKRRTARAAVARIQAARGVLASGYLEWLPAHDLAELAAAVADLDAMVQRMTAT